MQLLYALVVCAAALIAAPAEARLTRLEILQREVVAEGQSFGAAGLYVWRCRLPRRMTRPFLTGRAGPQLCPCPRWAHADACDTGSNR